jgi:hypothetical protein
MINTINTELQSIALHNVGNKSAEEIFQLSNHILSLNEEVLNLPLDEMKTEPTNENDMYKK